MITQAKTNRKMRNKSSNDSLTNSIRILSDMTRRDIEKSYNINDTQGTAAYYSNRYGWTLRRTTD